VGCEEAEGSTREIKEQGNICYVSRKSASTARGVQEHYAKCKLKASNHTADNNANANATNLNANVTNAQTTPIMAQSHRYTAYKGCRWRRVRLVKISEYSIPTRSQHRNATIGVVSNTQQCNRSGGSG
jgi:hypothetical protein